MQQQLQQSSATLKDVSKVYEGPPILTNLVPLPSLDYLPTAVAYTNTNTTLSKCAPTQCTIIATGCRKGLQEAYYCKTRYPGRFSDEETAWRAIGY